MFDTLSFVRRVSQVGTLLHVSLRGKKAGTDSFGNRYYTLPSGKGASKERRVVLYAAEPEASLVPPQWYGWLHHQCDQPLPSVGENGYVWSKGHEPNLTGSEVAHGARCPVQPTVQAWKPSVSKERS